MQASAQIVTPRYAPHRLSGLPVAWSSSVLTTGRRQILCLSNRELWALRTCWIHCTSGGVRLCQLSLSLLPLDCKRELVSPGNQLECLTNPCLCVYGYEERSNNTQIILYSIASARRGGWRVLKHPHFKRFRWVLPHAPSFLGQTTEALQISAGLAPPTHPRRQGHLVPTGKGPHYRSRIRRPGGL